MAKNKHVAIIGGGIAGLEAGSVLVQQGYEVTVLEKEQMTGGMLNNWSKLFPDFSAAAKHLSMVLELTIGLTPS